MPERSGRRRGLIVVSGQVTDGFMRDDIRTFAEDREVGILELDRAVSRHAGLRGWVARNAFNLRAFLREVRRVDAGTIAFWFVPTNYAPVLTAYARLTGRRTLVFTGGIDTVYIPEIDWGAMKSAWHRRMYGIVMRLADAVLPFSDSARDEIRRISRPRYLRTAYPAIDTTFFAPGGEPRRARVVTCCYAYHAGNIVQKGLDRFVDAAALVPEVEFHLVGSATDDAGRALAARVPPNVRLVPRIPDRDGYRAYLAGSAAYAQLSVHEGFGVSVAEAMACGAIPVVSDRFSLPEVVGDAGHVVPRDDLPGIAAAIRAAVAADEGAREAARARVAALFARERRAALLREELARLGAAP